MKVSDVMKLLIKFSRDNKVARNIEEFIHEIQMKSEKLKIWSVLKWIKSWIINSLVS